MQIYTCFYFYYIIYYGLLIFCCQNVANDIILKTRKYINHKYLYLQLVFWT